jgi:hypothetical protein
MLRAIQLMPQIPAVAKVRPACRRWFVSIRTNRCLWLQRGQWAQMRSSSKFEVTFRFWVCWGQGEEVLSPMCDRCDTKFRHRSRDSFPRRQGEISIKGRVREKSRAAWTACKVRAKTRPVTESPHHVSRRGTRASRTGSFLWRGGEPELNVSVMAGSALKSKSAAASRLDGLPATWTRYDFLLISQGQNSPSTT